MPRLPLEEFGRQVPRIYRVRFLHVQSPDALVFNIDLGFCRAVELAVRLFQTKIRNTLEALATVDSVLSKSTFPSPKLGYLLAKSHKAPAGSDHRWEFELQGLIDSRVVNLNDELVRLRVAESSLSAG